MDVKVVCPCGKGIRLRESKLGGTHPCPACGTPRRFTKADVVKTYPETAEPAPPPAPPVPAKKGVDCAHCGFTLQTEEDPDSLSCPRCRKPLGKKAALPAKASRPPTQRRTTKPRNPAIWAAAGVAGTLALLLILWVAATSGRRPSAPRQQELAGPTPVKPRVSAPPPAAPPSKARLPDLISRYRKSVVWIAAERSIFKSTGSGLVVRKDGFILTNDHVVRQAKRIRVGWENGAGYAAMDAELVFSFPEDDLALLRVPRSDLEPVPFFLDTGALRGADVVALGFPLSDAFGQESMSVTRGIVTGVGRMAVAERTPAEVVRIDAQVNPGNSGGPLVDVERSQVVGVDFARAGALSDASGYGFAVPMKRVLELMPEIAGDASAMERRAESASRSRLDSPQWRQELEKTRPYFRSLASSDPEVRRSIPIPTLIEALQDSQSTVRSFAARALEERGAEAAPARDALLKAMKDPNAVVRVDAATALAAVSPRDPQVLDVLVGALETGANTRETVVIALGRIGNREPRTLKALSACLGEEGRVFEAALRALDALKPEGHRAAVQVLAARLEESLRKADARPPVALVEGLGLCGKADPAQVAPVLIRALKSRTAVLGHACARSLADLGPAVLPQLSELLKETPPELRELGVTALGRIRPVDRQALEAAEGLARDPSPKVRAAVLSALAGAARDGAGVSSKSLLAFADDASSDLRASWAAAVGSLSSADPDLVRTLGKLLQDAEATVRKASLDALRRHAARATRLVPDIVSLLSDRDVDVRRLAAEALGAMGPAAESAAPRLLDLAKDASENGNVRFSAVRALQAILKKPKGE